ncbi:Low conductance mechanosensitive channel YnaI [Porphyridium purpureum]|uniref:Low conductance mechanosensitive channel YnaI n=1 Tax=Porphyridium purpureum TaxID=35688 RepID=A0A5J4YUV7_PORPP|nr:Low conductance mechanosensitive channel YnaI [Porphyridium purpureum]|eukprot:POR8492..scf227_4
MAVSLSPAFVAPGISRVARKRDGFGGKSNIRVGLNHVRGTRPAHGRRASKVLVPRMALGVAWSQVTPSQLSTVIRTVAHRAFVQGPQKFPSSLADFWVVVFIYVLDKVQFQTAHELYARFMRRFFPHVFVPRWKDSIFYMLEGVFEALSLVLLSAFVVKFAASLMLYGGIHIPEPAIVGARWCSIGTVVIAARLLIRVKQIFLSRRRKGSGFFALPGRALFVGQLGDYIIRLLAVLTIADIGGVPLRSVLTVGGFGSVVLGLAVRQLAENALAGVALMSEQMFRIGDVVQSKDGSIFGFVREVGWTQTRIERLDSSVQFVPNSELAKQTVTNLSRMTMRKVEAKLGVRLNDASKVEGIVSQIRKLIAATPGVMTSKSVRVFMDGVENEAIVISIAFYTIDADIDSASQLKQDVLLKSFQIIKDRGASVCQLGPHFYPCHWEQNPPGMKRARSFEHCCIPSSKAGYEPRAWATPADPSATALDTPLCSGSYAV